MSRCTTLISGLLALALWLPALRTHAQAAVPSVDPASNVQNIEQVQRRLDAAKRERAEASLLLPWLTLGVGAGSTAVALVVGAVHVLQCDSDCSTINWVAFTAVAGTTVAALGAVWVIRANKEVRLLDSHRYHLEQELERVRLSRLSHDVAPYRGGSVVSWRFTL